MTQTIFILTQFTQTEICSSQNKFRGLLCVVETNQTKQTNKKTNQMFTVNIYECLHLRTLIQSDLAFMWKNKQFTFAFGSFFASSLEPPANEAVIRAHALRAALTLSHSTVRKSHDLCLSGVNFSGSER